jgi:hypothetical protein
MSTGLFTCWAGEILAPGGLWFDARLRVRVATFAVWRWSVLNALSQRAKSQRMWAMVVNRKDVGSNIVCRARYFHFEAQHACCHPALLTVHPQRGESSGAVTLNSGSRAVRSPRRKHKRGFPADQQTATMSTYPPSGSNSCARLHSSVGYLRSAGQTSELDQSDAPAHIKDSPDGGYARISK